MGNSPNSPSNRRMVPRYSFVATTEIIDAENATKLTGRVTEISRFGCYVDIANALPVGTVLNVRITRDQGEFFTRGKIIYVQEYIGMGVVFFETSKDQQDILDSWLAELPPSS